MLLGLKNKIDKQKLLSSTVYSSDSFDRCAYCHQYVESDYFDYKGEWYQPHRCTCESAVQELKVKANLLKELDILEKKIDSNRINKHHKNLIISMVEESFGDNEPFDIDRL